MNRSVLLMLSMSALGSASLAQPEINVLHTNVCALEANPQGFAGTKIDLHGMFVMGRHQATVQEQGCKFLIVFGDDVQSFGNRFPAKLDEQWVLMRKLLNTPGKCYGHADLVKATMQGTVARRPATGTIPEDEMPLQFFIQSVSEVASVPLNCTLPNGS